MAAGPRNAQFGDKWIIIYGNIYDYTIYPVKSPTESVRVLRRFVRNAKIRTFWKAA